MNGDFAAATVLRRGRERLHFGLAVAGANPADIGEMIAAVDADQQRAETPFRRRPAADDDLVPGPAFGFGPARGAPRAIRRVEPFRNDPLKRQLARRAQNGVAAGVEMLDEPDQRLIAAALRDSKIFRRRSLRSASGRSRMSSPASNRRSKA